MDNYTATEQAYKNGYEQGQRDAVKHGRMRVEIITDDFRDIELAKVRGWYRKKFFCPYCDQLIKTETWDKHYMFGSSSILKTNADVNYCPNCGARMDLKETK